MATFTENTILREPGTGHGGGGFQPPEEGRGWGDGGSDSSPNFGDRLRRARLGLAIALVPILTMFIAFTAIYVLRRNFARNPDDNLLVRPEWISLNLPVGLLMMNTFLLLSSSLSVELARRQMKRRAVLAPVARIPGVSLGQESYFPWLGVTIVLGMTFLAGQWMAWRELAARGFYLATSPSSSLFYVLTAAHGLHLMGGLSVLLYAALAAVRRKSIEVRRIVVDVTALYWHFMLLLWIYIFALVWIAR